MTLRSMAVLSLVPLLMCMAVGCAHPPDDRLLARYEANRQIFQRMAGTVASNVETEPLGLDLGEVGILETRNHRRFGPEHPLYLIATERSSFTGGALKGYAYVDDPSELTIVESLDGRKIEDGEAFRPIEGNWYLFYSPE